MNDVLNFDAGHSAAAAAECREEAASFDSAPCRFSGAHELSEVGLEVDRPPAGTACRSCKLKGHFCQATEYFAEAPLCQYCLDSVPCSQAQAVVRMQADEPISDPNSFPSEVRYLDPSTVTIVPVDSAPPRKIVSFNRHEIAKAAALHRAVISRGGGKGGKGRGNVIDPEIAEKARELRRAGVTLESIAGRLGISCSTVYSYVRNVKKVSTVPALPQPIQAKEESRMTQTVDRPPKKQCIFEGCTRPASARGSYCTAKHFYSLQKELGLLGAAKKKKPAQKPAKAIAVTKPAAEPPQVWDKDKAGMATITVPNEALDRFWHALAWEEKARIVGNCIAGALRQGGELHG